VRVAIRALFGPLRLLIFFVQNALYLFLGFVDQWFRRVISSININKP
jgi:hypothetical protein